MQSLSPESFYLMITTASTIIDFEKAERDFMFLLLCFQEVDLQPASGGFHRSSTDRTSN